MAIEFYFKDVEHEGGWYHVHIVIEEKVEIETIKKAEGK